MSFLLSVVMLSVANKPIMLSVEMLNVVAPKLLPPVSIKGQVRFDKFNRAGPRAGIIKLITAVIYGFQ